MSNFSAARVHLELALDHLTGSDKITVQAREAIDLLIEAVATAEHRKTRIRKYENNVLSYFRRGAEL